MPSILIVDDEEDIRWSIKQILKASDLAFLEADSGRAAIQVFGRTVPDAVILDLRMPEMDGFEVLEKILELEPWMPVIVITGVDEVKSAVQALKMGASEYLVKPPEHEELRSAVRRALENVRLKREAFGRRDSIQYVFGKSLSMQKLHRTIEQIATRDVRVLIQGESGTGKQMVAEQLYLLSPRHDKPFVTIDCGVLPDTLMESELFGYEKGAFTGAAGRKTGKLEVAKGGTLFLDEIGNMNYNLQTKLLRVLETGQFERVGGNTSMVADFRLIMATNSNLSEMVRKGTFRSDLYYRINVFTIDIPALREHAEDIPELIEFFRDFFNKKHQKNVASISPECMHILKNYYWPGNIRQLRNVMERAVLIANETLDIAHLPDEIAKLTATPLGKTKGARVNLQSLEERALREALEANHGNKAAAAAELGISLRTLYYWIKRFELQTASEETESSAD